MLQIINRIKRPGHSLAGLVRKFWYLFPDDAKYLKLIYFLEMGRKLNLKDPKRFTEKLQWLKLYDRKPEYTRMVDKITAKEYVAEIIGEQYVVPTLGVWNHYDEIDFSRLPEKFVLKTNHGSGGGGVVICRDKNSFDHKSAKIKLERGLLGNTYNRYREWPYKNIEPKIFAEELLENESIKTQSLNDYKFYCFNGEVRFCQVIKDRNEKETIDFYDVEWKHLSFIGLNPASGQNYSNSRFPIPKPYNMPKMIDIAKKLSVGKSFSRIDLYEIGKKIYFGEITLYPASGIGFFQPDNYDYIMGKFLKLPKA